jgi:predicted secreted protein
MARFTIWHASAFLAAVLTLTVGATNAQAQTAHDDVDVWTSLLVATPVGSRTELRADGMLQATNDASRVGWELARIILVGTLNERVTAGGGYAWFRVEDATGRHAVEHRAVQELALRIPLDRRAVVISLRTRLEERHRETYSATAFRLRQQARVDIPLGARGLRATGWNESFFALNTTAWSGRSGPSFILDFVGLHVPVLKGMAIEPGYLSQTEFVTSRNRMHHAVALFVTLRLG